MIHLQHIIEAQQFSRENLLDLFEHADHMRDLVKNQGCTDTLHNKAMVVLFYQPSTRTRLSFETAMVRLGGALCVHRERARFLFTCQGRKP